MSVTYRFLGNSRSRGYADAELATITLHHELTKATNAQAHPYSPRLLKKIAEVLRAGTNLGVSVQRVTARENPTLVHHGIAQGAAFHLLSKHGAPFADLYFGNRTVAKRVGQLIADHYGTPLVLATNDPSGEFGRITEAESRRRSPLDRPKGWLTDIEAAGRANPRTNRLKWNVYGGGTGGWEGSNSYGTRTPWGQYTIAPVTTQYGRRAGYRIHFNNGGPGLRPLPAHMYQAGLYRDLGSARSPNAAKAIAQAHHDAVTAGETQPNPYEYGFQTGDRVELLMDASTGGHELKKGALGTLTLVPDHGPNVYATMDSLPNVAPLVLGRSWIMPHRGRQHLYGDGSNKRSDWRQPRRRRNPGPAVGQVWAKRGGGRSRVLALAGSRVHVVDLATGNRAWVPVSEFHATHREPPRGNPGKRARAGWIGTPEGASDPVFRLNTGQLVLAHQHASGGPRHWIVREQAERFLGGQVMGPRHFEVWKPAGGRMFYLRFLGSVTNPRAGRRELSVPDRHQLKIARDTLKMSEAGARIMGGPNHAEAREIIYRLTGKWPAESNPSRSLRARFARSARREAPRGVPGAGSRRTRRALAAGRPEKAHAHMLSTMGRGRFRGVGTRDNPSVFYDRRSLPEMAGRIARVAFPGYSGNKFELVAKDHVHVNNMWQGGSREQTVFVRLDNLSVFQPPDSYHVGGQDATIPEGVVAVQHTIFLGKDHGLRFIVPRSAEVHFPPPPSDVSQDELIVLDATRSWKSSYGGIKDLRFHEATSYSGITRERWDAAKASLISRGLLNKAGAITATGKTAAGDFRVDRMKRTNPRARRIYHVESRGGVHFLISSTEAGRGAQYVMATYPTLEEATAALDNIRRLTDKPPAKRRPRSNPGAFWAELDAELADRGMGPVSGDEAAQLEAQGWGKGKKTVPGNAAFAVMMFRGQGAGQRPNPGSEYREHYCACGSFWTPDAREYACEGGLEGVHARARCYVPFLTEPGGSVYWPEWPEIKQKAVAAEPAWVRAFFKRWSQGDRPEISWDWEAGNEKNPRRRSGQASGSDWCAVDAADSYFWEGRSSLTRPQAEREATAAARTFAGRQIHAPIRVMRCAERQAEMAARPRGARRNPGPFAGGTLERARDTFRMWHEFDAHGVKPVQVPSRRIPRHVVKLGEVTRIDYKSNKWEGQPVTYTHSTKRPRPILVTDPDAKQLFIVGGKMRPTADGLVN